MAYSRTWKNFPRLWCARIHPSDTSDASTCWTKICQTRKFRVGIILGFGVSNQFTGEKTFPAFHVSCIPPYVTYITNPSKHLNRFVCLFWFCMHVYIAFVLVTIVQTVSPSQLWSHNTPLLLWQLPFWKSNNENKHGFLVKGFYSWREARKRASYHQPHLQYAPHFYIICFIFWPEQDFPLLSTS